MSDSHCRMHETSPIEQWLGAGWFNFYFLLKFGLTYTGYINLNVAYNALLFAFVLFPIGSRLLHRLRVLISVAAAFALLWHESWLPGPQAIVQNANNLANFSFAYLVDLAVASINPHMVAWGVVAFIAFIFLRHWIRFSAITTLGLIVATFPQIGMWFQSDTSVTASYTSENQTTQAPGSSAIAASPVEHTGLKPAQSATANSDNIDKWFDSFHVYEQTRKVEFPNSRVDNSASGTFDIAIVNICSLSNDDLTATGLEDHPFLKRFDIRFTNFNSGTAYSGPASLRLLRSACGQYSHPNLYEGRQPDCEILNRLKVAGWDKSSLYGSQWSIR